VYPQIAVVSETAAEIGGYTFSMAIKNAQRRRGMGQALREEQRLASCPEKTAGRREGQGAGPLALPLPA